MLNTVAVSIPVMLVESGVGDDVVCYRFTQRLGRPHRNAIKLTHIILAVAQQTEMILVLFFWIE